MTSRNAIVQWSMGLQLLTSAPFLPARRRVPCTDVPADRADDCMEEAWEAHHFSLFAPRDFDVSPYFAVVKPSPVPDFDYTRLRWAG